MRKRIGDRRGRGRFEIVGSLTGTLETIRRLRVRNVGSGGALLDTTVPFAPGNRVSGRLALSGQSREVRGEVRHVTTFQDRDEGMRYLVGVEWEASPQLDDLLRMEPHRSFPAAARPGPERRAGLRIVPGGEADMGHPNWVTVELIDISTTGVLFAAPVVVDIGERAELRMRLGDRSFAAQVEVRRSDARKPSSHPVYRMGASFVALDESNRLHLEDFIGDARP
jgi:PilZ domain